MSKQDDNAQAVEDDTTAALARGDGMAYDGGRRERPLLYVFGALEQVVGRGEYEAREIAEMVEEGADESWGATTITIRGREKPMLSAALHAIGFFSEELGDIARGLLLRLLEQNAKDLDALTEEQLAAMNEVCGRVEEKRLRAIFGSVGLDYMVAEEPEEPAA